MLPICFTIKRAPKVNSAQSLTTFYESYGTRIILLFSNDNWRRFNNIKVNRLKLSGRRRGLEKKGEERL